MSLITVSYGLEQYGYCLKGSVVPVQFAEPICNWFSSALTALCRNATVASGLPAKYRIASYIISAVGLPHMEHCPAASELVVIQPQL